MGAKLFEFHLLESAIRQTQSESSITAFLTSTSGILALVMPLLDMLSDEFEFLFPAGVLRGKHTGLEGKQNFLQWVQKRAPSRSRKTTDLKLFFGDWVGSVLHGRDR
jgi:hypothetical protein